MQDQSIRGCICLRRTHVAEKRVSQDQTGLQIVEDNLSEMDCVVIQQMLNTSQSKTRPRWQGRMKDLQMKPEEARKPQVAIDRTRRRRKEGQPLANRKACKSKLHPGGVRSSVAANGQQATAAASRQ